MSFIKLPVYDIICRENDIHTNEDPGEHLDCLLSCLPKVKRRARRLLEAVYNLPGKDVKLLGELSFMTEDGVRESAFKANPILITYGVYIAAVKTLHIAGIEPMHMQGWYLLKCSSAQSRMLLEKGVI